MRTTNKAGLDLIREFEGLRLKAYPDPGTGGEPWTIGYGHTGDVFPGMVISADQATAYLINDLATAEQFVARVAPVATDNQFAAMVSFAFNCGRKNLQTSSLLRFHNSGDYKRAAAEFGKWTHAAGRVLPGLVKRRAAERELYLS